jgi:hypothetical protein
MEGILRGHLNNPERSSGWPSWLLFFYFCHTGGLNSRPCTNLLVLHRGKLRHRRKKGLYLFIYFWQWGGVDVCRRRDLAVIKEVSSRKSQFLIPGHFTMSTASE